MGASIGTVKIKRSRKSKSEENVAYETIFSRNPISSTSTSSIVNFQDKVWKKKTAERSVKAVDVRDNNEFFECSYVSTPDYHTLPGTALTKTENVYVNVNPTKAKMREESSNCWDSASVKQVEFFSSDSGSNSNPCQKSPKARRRESSVTQQLPPIPKSETQLKEVAKEETDNVKYEYSMITGRKDNLQNYYMKYTHPERPNPRDLFQLYTAIALQTDDKAICEEGDNNNRDRGNSQFVDEVQRCSDQERDIKDMDQEEMYTDDHAERAGTSFYPAKDKGYDDNAETKSELNDETADYEYYAAKNQRRLLSYRYSGGVLTLNQYPRKESRLPPSAASNQCLQVKPFVFDLEASQEQTASVSSDSLPPSRVQDGIVFFSVASGSLRKLSHMTLRVPASVGHVEVGLGNNPVEFPPLSDGQRVLTGILHCLPHGATFPEPVVIAIDIDVELKGLVEIRYSPTDMGKPKAWTSMTPIDCENTRFTENCQTCANEVFLLKKERKVVFLLHHFCSFAVVENGKPSSFKKAQLEIFFKTVQRSQHSVAINVKVHVGCDQKQMVSKFKALTKEGFQKIEETECLLYQTSSESSVTVGIKDILSAVRFSKTQQIEPMTHSLHCLWNGSVAVSLFWTEIRSCNQSESFGCTVFLQQDGRIEKSARIFCNLGQIRCPLRKTPVPTRGLNEDSEKRIFRLNEDSEKRILRLKEDSEKRMFRLNEDSEKGIFLVSDPCSVEQDNTSSSDKDYEMNYNCHGGEVSNYNKTAKDDEEITPQSSNKTQVSEQWLDKNWGDMKVSELCQKSFSGNGEKCNIENADIVDRIYAATKNRPELERLIAQISSVLS